jgi:hypothetical protein
MRFLLVSGLVSSMALCPAGVFAADYTATIGKVTSETKTLNSGNNYTAIENLDEKTSEDDGATTEQTEATENETPTECTAEHRKKLGDYDQILVNYYEDSADITKRFADFDNSEQFSEAQAKIQAYSDFIGSQEYKDSILLRQLCEMPAPPRPYQWPEWLPVPDPMSIGNGPAPETVVESAAAAE